MGVDIGISGILKEHRGKGTLLKGIGTVTGHIITEEFHSVTVPFPIWCLNRVDIYFI